MNYLPLLAFLLAVAWIVRQGFVSKREYERDRKKSDKTPSSVSDQASHNTPRPV
jgi:hypothetical protein